MREHELQGPSHQRDLRRVWSALKRIMLTVCILNIAWGIFGLVFMFSQYGELAEWYGFGMLLLAGTFGLRVVKQLQRLEARGAAA